jgi:hypothetical protein
MCAYMPPLQFLTSEPIFIKFDVKIMPFIFCTRNYNIMNAQTCEVDVILVPHNLE